MNVRQYTTLINYIVYECLFLVPCLPVIKRLLQGVAEIDLLVDKLTASYQFGGILLDWILPLHSSLSAFEQKKVFLTPPQNIRKVFVTELMYQAAILLFSCNFKSCVLFLVFAGSHHYSC